MRAIAALLAISAAAQQQPRAPSQQEQIRALAAATDDAAREKALLPIDDVAFFQLSTHRYLAAREAPAVREAVRRWLPHPAWINVMQGKTGEVRRKQRELLGPDPSREPGGFARAVTALLDRDDPPSQVVALKLLKGVPAPLPEKLVPFLLHKDPMFVRAAAEALRGVARAGMKPQILQAFWASTPATDFALAPLAAGVATSEDVPELLGLLKADPRRERAIMDVVRTAAGPGDEPALLELFANLGDRDPAPLLDAISLVGTAASIGPVRKYRDSLPPGSPKRGPCTQALLALRDPALAPELAADPAGAPADLARLGNREVVPALRARLKDRMKVEERNRLLLLLGQLGGPAEVELVSSFVEDERHADAAATALLALGDPRAAAPLARALRMAGPGSSIARALFLLPPPFEGVDEPLLEILDDPEGHGSSQDAFRVAARSGSPRLREKVLSGIADRPPSNLSSWAVWEILPLLTPADREALQRGKSAPGEAILLALAATGDAESLKGFVDLCSRQRRSMRHPTQPARMLEMPGMAAVVEEAFKSNPAWIEGAEWLALHGNKAGVELLREQLKKEAARGPGNAARALLRLGDPVAIEALVSHAELQGSFDTREDLDEADLARLLDGPTVERFRELASTQPANRAALRLLAHRGDPVVEALVRSQLRPAPTGLSASIHEEGAAAALARAGATSLRPDFVRMLRSASPRRRVLGARCLGLLGDRTAVHDLVPLLDDRQSEPRMNAPVREAAAEAIERLAGRAFEGPPAARIDAIRSWYARERESLR